MPRDVGDEIETAADLMNVPRHRRRLSQMCSCQLFVSSLFVPQRILLVNQIHDFSIYGRIS